MFWEKLMIRQFKHTVLLFGAIKLPDANVT